MAQPAFNSAASRRAVDRAMPARRGAEIKRPSEMELKFAALQKDYADLHEAIFEAAQVHRRLCAPRLLRFGDFEIASEIFAVRHLPGDFFTVEQTNEGVVLALGDICGKGLFRQRKRECATQGCAGEAADRRDRPGRGAGASPAGDEE